MSNQLVDAASRNWRLQGWLRIHSNDKPKAYLQVFAMAETASVKYWLEIFFSAGIATFGLVENSPAVIIGAMLISPLMGPIMATGMALAVGDIYLGAKAIFNILLSVSVSITFSGLLVWLLPFHFATSEILARTNPNLLDLGIALLSGLAGSVVVSRGAGDGATALPGVAIAVALMPPLCTMGFGLGSGRNLEIMGGAGLLFLTNLVAIVASAFLVFFLVGMPAPEVQEAVLASRGDEPLGHLLSHSRIARLLETGGNLRWRVLMVLILLGSLSIPLQRALTQVAGEAVSRSAVQDELKRLVPPDAIVSQQVSWGRGAIAIHLISTRRVPESRVAEVRKSLMHRTGRDVQLSVEAVASKVELADLMARLASSPAAVPGTRSLADFQKELLGKIRPALDDIWPVTDAPIQDFAAVLGTTEITVDVSYESAAELGPVATEMILQQLRKSLGTPDLLLNCQRITPRPAVSVPQQASSEKRR